MGARLDDLTTTARAADLFHVLSPSFLPVPADWPPTLAVVVDTEEEFDWHGPFDRAATAVRNIAHQPLAQGVFDRFGIVPTYVVDYPVATSDDAVAVLAPIAADGRCEIGAHLHPWVTPPYREEVGAARNSFPGNLPPDLERDKLAVLTGAITGRFGARPRIYKAGRYGVGPQTMAHLAALDYRTDVSVVPHTDFSADGGPDFSAFPARPFLTPPGILACPLSVGFVGALASRGAGLYPALCGRRAAAWRLGGVAARLGLLQRLRLSPEGHGLADLVALTRSALHHGQRLFMLTYHSSSLLPGGSPYVRDPDERTAFLATLAAYCDFFLRRCGGRTVSVGALHRMLLPPPATPRPAPAEGLSPV